MNDHKRDFYEKMYESVNNDDRDGLCRSLSTFEESRYDVVYKLLPGGERLLDIGCGDGNFVIKSREKYHEAYGVDITDVMIKRAKKNATERNSTRVSFSRADADNRLPFEDGYFDTITCIASLQFMFDPYQVVSEFHRVLKQGGTLIVQVVNIAFLPRRLALFFGRFPVTARQCGWDGGTLHYFTFPSCSRLLSEIGFQVTHKTNSGILAGCRRLWPSLLAGDIIVKGIKL